MPRMHWKSDSTLEVIKTSPPKKTNKQKKLKIKFGETTPDKFSLL